MPFSQPRLHGSILIHHQMSLLNGTTLSLSVIPFNNDISLSSNTSADGFSNVG